MKEETIFATSKLGKVFERKKQKKNNDSQFFIRLPKDKLEMFKIICKKNNIKMSKVARELIDKYIRENV